MAHGAFDYARQVSIRNQNYEGQPGVYLVTPLLISGSDKAVLVNRGWIPVGEADPATWHMFDEQQSGSQTGMSCNRLAAIQTEPCPKSRRIP